VVRIAGSPRFVAASRIFGLAASGGRTVPIRFSTRQLRRLRAAARHGRKVTATVFGVLVSRGGRVESQTGGKRLRIVS
jgi:hypothetical protein